MFFRPLATSFNAFHCNVLYCLLLKTITKFERFLNRLFMQCLRRLGGSDLTFENTFLSVNLAIQNLKWNSSKLLLIVQMSCTENFSQDHITSFTFFGNQKHITVQFIASKCLALERNRLHRKLFPYCYCTKLHLFSAQLRHVTQQTTCNMLHSKFVQIATCCRSNLYRLLQTKHVQCPIATCCTANFSQAQRSGWWGPP